MLANSIIAPQKITIINQLSNYHSFCKILRIAEQYTFARKKVEAAGCTEEELKNHHHRHNHRGIIGIMRMFTEYIVERVSVCKEGLGTKNILCNAEFGL